MARGATRSSRTSPSWASGGSRCWAWRTRRRWRRSCRAGGGVPDAVAAAVDAELATLSAPARGLLDAAAVAGDPFELDLAAAIGEQSDEPLAALDELLRAALVRPADAPRRFAFRHPIVRH